MSSRPEDKDLKMQPGTTSIRHGIAVAHLEEGQPPSERDLEIEALFNSFKASEARNEVNRRAHVVAELTALSLLIDAGIATVDTIAERMEVVANVMSAEYRSADVAERTKHIVGVLRLQYECKPDQPRWQPVVIDGDAAGVRSDR
jgi:hypothetical protein